ncbi:MAG TPA: DNA-formamidopyrimidine glycosylase family protein [Bryobacteraceae bacterium]|jgi:formamidopyrimidine-DNA glycosylase|nr:DNA-formamidopyrimidine glycosylase family protein [Bryobacteraceae bacterium]
MPELPDVTVYVEAIAERVIGHKLLRTLIRGPFLLRSIAPPVNALEGRTVREVRRLGKRIALGFEGDLWLVLHLMIAGRLHWRDAAPKLSARGPLAVFEFDNGALTLTEAGTQHRAALHIVAGEPGLWALDAGGIDVFAASLSAFAQVLQSANHTLKRALTDPRMFSGIGNSYSDEILHRAMLSPVALTQKLPPEAVDRLYRATRETLEQWTGQLRTEARGRFPEKVTAFREGMAVHGRYGQPCPRCGTPIQRIRYASNETNYCPTCQTAGKLLADRALSRLLHQDWPRTLEELELLKRR